MIDGNKAHVFRHDHCEEVFQSHRNTAYVACLEARIMYSSLHNICWYKPVKIKMGLYLAKPKLIVNDYVFRVNETDV